MSSPRVILGITDSINAGAALLIDGRITAAVSEERLCRIKMAMGWPRQSIQEVLRISGIDPKDVEAVAVATKHLYWRPDATTIGAYFDAGWGLRKKAMLTAGAVGASLLGGSRSARRAYYQAKQLLTRNRPTHVRRALRDEFGITAPVMFIDHHYAHAASAYYTGGQENAMVVTLDGAGDHVSATVYEGAAGSLKRIHTVDSYDSVGNYYSYITHLLGFKAHRHEGKITGLAALGEPIYAPHLRKLIRFEGDSIRNRARAFHTSAVEKLRSVLPADARREDVAASIQLVLEETCTDYVRHWSHKLNARHLSAAGGVVANVKLNQRLLELEEVESIFIHPGMGDDGLAVGAALAHAADTLDPSKRVPLIHEISDVYLGAEYSENEMQRAMDAQGVEYEYLPDPAPTVAKALADGLIVARFDGRMEYGPRALGNRSILVHAGDPTVNDWLNKRLNRTEFMPFAPVTLEEDADACYTKAGLSGARLAMRFMTITTDCTEMMKRTCPATVHVDGTARPQLVGTDRNCSGYRAILEAYRSRTGISTIINTSFNMHEEPIVATPDDAVRAFLLGHLDILLMGNFLARQPGTDHSRTEDRRSEHARDAAIRAPQQSDAEQRQPQTDGTHQHN